MVVGLLSNVGLVAVALGTFFGVFSLFMVSGRFLHTLIVLEQLNAVLLMGNLVIFAPQEGTYFVALLIMFTVEAVVGLVVLTRVWSLGSLVGMSWW